MLRHDEDRLNNFGEVVPGLSEQAKLHSTVEGGERRGWALAHNAIAPKSSPSENWEGFT